MQLEIQFQIAVRIPNSIQNAKKMTPREGLRLLPEILRTLLEAFYLKECPPTTMWLELNLDSYERSMCARHACRLWSRLTQATPAALTMCIGTMRDRLFRCLGYTQGCHAKTAS